MKIQGILLAALLGVGTTGIVHADETVPVDGRKGLPRAAESSLSRGAEMAAIRDIVQELGAEDSQAVLGFIDELYALKDKYVQVMEMEVKLQQSSNSNEDQKVLMKQYIHLLQEEKDAARNVIQTIQRDVEALESRMLQVMAKIHRIGDRAMKTTIANICKESRKNIMYLLQNSHGRERAFYTDALRFLDQYFR